MPATAAATAADEQYVRRSAVRDCPRLCHRIGERIDDRAIGEIGRRRRAFSKSVRCGERGERYFKESGPDFRANTGGFYGRRSLRSMRRYFTPAFSVSDYTKIRPAPSTLTRQHFNQIRQMRNGGSRQLIGRRPRRSGSRGVTRRI